MGKTYIAIFENEVYSFATWRECEDFVKDKKNIKFRGFSDKLEIKKFIDDNIKKNISTDLDDVLYAYVDGCRYVYRKQTVVYSWGVCFVKNGVIIDKTKGICTEEIQDDSSKVKAELTAVMNAIQSALNKKEKRIIILYNFIGVEMWANKSWKAKTEEIAAYVKFIEKSKEEIIVDFLKFDNCFSKNEHMNSKKILDEAHHLAEMEYFDFKKKNGGTN